MAHSISKWIKSINQALLLRRYLAVSPSVAIDAAAALEEGVRLTVGVSGFVHTGGPILADVSAVCALEVEAAEAVVVVVAEHLADIAPTGLERWTA